MIRSCSALVLTAVFQVIFGLAKEPVFDSGPRLASNEQIGYAHPIPNHCLSPPPGVDLQKCCPIPKLFPDEDLERCGIEKASEGRANGPPKSIVPCKDSICLMQNANMLLANQIVDYEKLRTFVDNWAASNPEYTEAILEAKKRCTKDEGVGGPPRVCEQDRIFLCLTSSILWNCNIRESNVEGGCRTLKAHMDECRPYYWKQMQEEQNI